MEALIPQQCRAMPRCRDHLDGQGRCHEWTRRVIGLEVHSRAPGTRYGAAPETPARSSGWPRTGYSASAAQSRCRLKETSLADSHHLVSAPSSRHLKPPDAPLSLPKLKAPDRPDLIRPEHSGSGSTNMVYSASVFARSAPLTQSPSTPGESRDRTSSTYGCCCFWAIASLSGWSLRIRHARIP